METGNGSGPDLTSGLIGLAVALVGLFAVMGVAHWLAL